MAKNTAEIIRSLKIELLTLYYAYKDPRTKWYAKFILMMIVLHSLSPIDLIPDFIPGIGYLDDMIIIPLGIWLSKKLIQREILEECRIRAEKTDAFPKSILAAFVVVTIWIILTLISVCIVWHFLKEDSNANN